MSSAVTLFSWSQDSDYVYAATANAEVVRIPLEDCLKHLTCSECVGSADPLCGWCSIEAKCSRVSYCHNSSVLDRYIKNGQSNQCFDVVNVQPEKFVTDLIVDNTFLVS